MEPGIETGRVAEGPKVPPHDDQCILESVLGAIDIAEDAVRKREEPVDARAQQLDERGTITALSREYQVLLHHDRPASSLGDVVQTLWPPCVAQRSIQTRTFLGAAHRHAVWVTRAPVLRRMRPFASGATLHSDRLANRHCSER